MPLQNIVLTTIRFLSLIAEATVGTVKGDLDAGEVRRELLDVAEQASDRVEHIAQYAMAGLDDATRRDFIRTDVEWLLRTLDKYAPALRSRMPYAIPAHDDVAALLEAIGAKDHSGT